jgi:hypothetical protein
VIDKGQDPIEAREAKKALEQELVAINSRTFERSARD